MTSLNTNYGWTPKLIAQDKELKEKYGLSAHITPAKTYAGILERNPESDVFAPKKSDKKNTAVKVAAGVVLTAFAVFVLKKGAPKLKELLGLGKKVSHHAPQSISEKDKKMAEVCLEKLKSVKNNTPQQASSASSEVVTKKFKKMYGFSAEQKVVKDLKTGKSKTVTEFYGDALDTKPLKTHKIVGGKKITEIKGRNGVIDSYSTSFNKETGIITRKHKNGVIIQFNKNGDRIQYKLDANGKVDGPVWIQHRQSQGALFDLGHRSEYMPCFWQSPSTSITNNYSYIMAPENFQKAINDFKLPFQV